VLFVLLSFLLWPLCCLFFCLYSRFCFFEHASAVVLKIYPPLGCYTFPRLYLFLYHF
jgi:hypothetical protein